MHSGLQLVANCGLNPRWTFVVLWLACWTHQVLASAAVALTPLTGVLLVHFPVCQSGCFTRSTGENHLDHLGQFPRRLVERGQRGFFPREQPLFGPKRGHAHTQTQTQPRMMTRTRLRTRVLTQAHTPTQTNISTASRRRRRDSSPCGQSPLDF